MDYISFPKKIRWTPEKQKTELLVTPCNENDKRDIKYYMIEL